LAQKLGHIYMPLDVVRTGFCDLQPGCQPFWLVVADLP
jgi:hypothetical protein